MENKLEITTCDIFDRESDEELDMMLDSEYYPTSSDESSSEEEPDFKCGFVYMISSTGTDKVYIGSTINPVARWSVHKSKFNKGINTCTSKFILDYGNYTFTVLAQLKFTTTIALKAIELQVMKQYEGRLVNKIRNTFSKVAGDSKTSEYIKAKNDNQNTIKYTCGCCNKETPLRNKNRHEKTKKHIANLKAVEDKKALLLKLSKDN